MLSFRAFPSGQSRQLTFSTMITSRPALASRAAVETPPIPAPTIWNTQSSDSQLSFFGDPQLRSRLTDYDHSGLSILAYAHAEQLLVWSGKLSTEVSQVLVAADQRKKLRQSVSTEVDVELCNAHYCISYGTARLVSVQAVAFTALMLSLSCALLAQLSPSDRHRRVSI